jgi:hypothetical protein
MSCPYLKEIVMLCCQAYPVRKMVPFERLATASPCIGGDFQECPAFKDVLTRLKASVSEDGRHKRASGSRQKPG